VRPLPPEEALKRPPSPLGKADRRELARFSASIWHPQIRTLAVTNAPSEETVFFEVPLRECVGGFVAIPYPSASAL
jgi:hypothetical protein